MHTVRTRRFAGALTFAVALSPLVPVIVYSVNARGSSTSTECVAAVAFDSGVVPASVTRVCPESNSPTETTIEIRNIGP